MEVDRRHEVCVLEELKTVITADMPEPNILVYRRREQEICLRPSNIHHVTAVISISAHWLVFQQLEFVQSRLWGFLLLLVRAFRTSVVPVCSEHSPHEND